MQKVEFTLTRKKYPNLILTLEELKKVNFFVAGYRLPNEIYFHLDGTAKEAWDLGWRGGCTRMDGVND